MKLLFITGSRGEWGYIKPILKICNEKNIEYEILVTNMHLLPQHGNTIDEIIQDFFNVNKEDTNTIINNAKKSLIESTDYFSYGKILNESFSITDKVDFLSCIFEVAYSDGEYHYLEEHMIKKIANILHIENKDLVNVKMDIKRLFRIDS